MKTNCLYLAIAALSLAAVSCAKNSDADVVYAGFTVNIPENGTKAVIDGDGAAANVNRCKLQVMLGNDVYKTIVKTATPGTLTYEFKDVPLVKGLKYDFLFWADCSDDGVDKYYSTDLLTNVSFMRNDVGNLDEIDAFCNQPDETVTQSYRLIGQEISEDFTKTVTLKRPLAQLNVITEDLDEIASIDMANAMKPVAVSCSYRGCTSFNVRTNQYTGGSKLINIVNAPIYNEKTGTIAMYYVLPFEGSEVTVVNFVTTCAGGTTVSNSWENVPLKRNWRTNIKGRLLTRKGDFTVSVSPEWNGEIEYAK